MQHLNITTREYTFDSGHRVMYNSDGCGHKGKCSSCHGHTYKVISSFSYSVATHGNHLGYAVDFGEIKRVFIRFIEKYFDHGFISNPEDPLLKSLIEDESKIYIMTLGNPTAENIAKELFYIGSKLMENHGLKCHEIELYETPKCSVKSWGLSEVEINLLDSNVFLQEIINNYKHEIGFRSHDIREN